jgi:hypothetical protein
LQQHIMAFKTEEEPKQKLSKNIQEKLQSFQSLLPIFNVRCLFLKL